MEFRNFCFSLCSLLVLNSCSTNSARIDPKEVSAFNSQYANKNTDDEKERVLAIADGSYKDVIRDLSSPLEAALYCTEVLKYDKDINVYGVDSYFGSFKKIHENKRDDCDGGALAAAAILSDDGFPPYMLIIKGDLKAQVKAHVVFLYKDKNGKYGSIGINRLDVNPPIFDSVDSLANKLAMDAGFSLNCYEIYDLSKVYSDFIDNDKDNDPEN